MKFLYGLTFVAIIPVLLVMWAHATSSVVDLPLSDSSLAGISLAAAGILLMGAGMLGLMIHGKGVPMNAFPPPHYVNRGIYRIFPHPIYLGFSLVCFGTAILFQSPSGFWLVAPVATLACVAIVMGYEKEDLRRRFGAQIVKSYLALPDDSDRDPLPRERLSIYILVFIPWIVLYEAIIALGIPSDSIPAYWSFEHLLPVSEWTELIYGGTYVFILSVPLLASTSRILRQFAAAGLVATGVMTLLFIGVPFIAPPRNFTPQGFLGEWLLLERRYDSAVAAFPSFHVVWSVLAAHALTQSFPRGLWMWWMMAIVISASCITTGMHAVIDVLAGFSAGLAFMNHRRAWEIIRSSAERLANSWREWNFGPFRIINHGVYTGAGAASGLLTVGVLLGFDALGYAILMAFLSLITSGLWAQFVEGSPSLLRPYGYYGGVIGIALGAWLADIMGGNAWLLLGAYGVAAPAIQSLGRLRCLVQGCCHGREAPPHIGIRYTHPRSRVCCLADLAGVPVHATPVYSILWNMVMVMVLARLWSLHASPSLIAGLYLILSGLGRFVEESYRGEPQTPLLGGLTLYQVLAILSVVAGAILTTVYTTVTRPGMSFDIRTLIAAVAFGTVTWFAQGVDFPKSNHRFSRLV